jgi:hypothetical protein
MCNARATPYSSSWRNYIGRRNCENIYFKRSKFSGTICGSFVVPFWHEGGPKRYERGIKRYGGGPKRYERGIKRYGGGPKRYELLFGTTNDNHKPGTKYHSAEARLGGEGTDRG